MFVLFAFIGLSVAQAIGCPALDSAGNLVLFTSYGDFSVNSDFTQFTTIPKAANRPPFISTNLVCLPSFNLNAVFFINADPQFPGTLHSYQFESRTWRNFTMNNTPRDLSQIKAVIDFDTLVIYAFDKGEMIRLGNAGDENLSRTTTLTWVSASNNAVPSNLRTINDATFAHGLFNMIFFNVPGTQPGQVWAYRIHYNEYGARPQPVQGDFPVTHGQVATFRFRYPEQNEHGGSPAHVAFVPDDGSGTWVVNAWANTTTKSRGPGVQKTSKLTRMTASTTHLIQFTPDTGMLRTMDFRWLANKQANPDNSWVESTIALPVSTDAATGASPGTNTGSASPNSPKNEAFSLQPFFTLLFLAYCLRF